MKRLEGGYLGGRPTWSLASNPGIWGIEQVYARRVAGTWPAGGGSFDEYYEYVTFMLHADGANASTSFPDSSLYGRAVTVNGNAQVSTAQSKFGGASIAFDGNGDYLSVPSSTALDFQSGDYTIELWVRFNSVGSFQTILSRYQTWATVVQFYLELTTSSTIKYRAGNNIPVSVTSSTVVATNTWYHVAITCSSSITRLFINGQLEASTGTAAVLSSNQPLGIGYELSGNVAYLNGYIDELRITKGYARYTSNFSVPTAPYEDEGAPLADPFHSNVSLLLPMNGSNNSTTFTDKSPNALTVTANGDAKLSTAVKRYGTASAVFDGTGDWLYRAPNTALDFPGDFTLECWIRWSTVTNGGIFHLYPGTPPGSTAGIAIGYDGSNFAIYSGNTSYQRAYTVTSGVWYHVALVRASSSLTLYINGASQGASISDSTNYGGNGLNIGLYYSSSYTFNGYIDDLRITKGVARYIGNFIPPLPHADYGTLTDPYLAASTLWMPMEGPVNSTGFFDRADRLPVTTYGNAKISNAQYKWGLTSAAFDGSGDYVTIQDSDGLNFASSDFTIEMWVYSTAANPNNTYLYSKRTSVAVASVLVLFSNSTLRFLATADNSTWSFDFTTTASITQNRWTHIAFTRSGTSWRVFFDGVQVGAQTSSISIATTTAPVAIGTSTSSGAGDFFAGYIDDLRIIKGHACYTTNFTPPTAPINADTSSDPYLSNVSLLLKMDGANNSTAFTDSSLTPKTVFANGDAKISTAQSKFGGASALLDGTGDYLSLAHNAEFSIESSNFTLEAWIYVSASNVLQNILNKRVNTPTESGWGWRITAANALQFFHTGGSVLTSTSTISSGTWTHVAVTRSGSTVRQFINGILDATTATFSNGVSNTQELRIGIDEGAAGGFNGYIDDLRVTKGVARYTANFIPPTISHPVWSETDASFSSVSLLLNGNGANASTVVADRSSNASTVVPNGNAQISTTQGRFGGSSLYFDGSGDYLSVAANSVFEFGASSFTWEAWVYINSLSAVNGLYYYGSGNSNRLQISVLTDGSFQAYMETASGFIDLLSSASAVTANTWTHLAVSRDGNTWRSFVNGIVAATATSSLVAPAGQSPNIGFAVTSSINRYCNGYIDDLRITKGVARYTTTFTPPVAPLPIPVIDPYFGAVSLLLHMNGANASTTFPDHSYNALAVTANGNAQISTAQSKFGGASALFDGTGDYLALTGRSFSTSNFTVEGWIYVATPASGFAILDTRDQDLTNSGFAFYVRSTSKLALGTGSPFVATEGPTTITANSWHHVALVRSSGTIKGYLNGVEEFSVANTASLSLTGWRIGNFWNAPTISSGYIDDLRITNGVARYTANFTPPATQFPNS